MERLTERFSNGQAAVLGCGNNCKYDFKYCKTYNENCPTMTRIYEKLARYEDMEERGKLLILPCKPEDTVYVISNYSNYRKSDYEIIKAVVTTVRLKSDGKTVCFSCRGKWKNQNPYIGNFTSNSVGKTVFMTEQEAKEALEEMKE